MMRRTVPASLCCLLIATAIASSAQTFTKLVDFAGANGANPSAPLIQASDGNFYGTTPAGGVANYGIVFKMTRESTLTTLHSFHFTDGGTPHAGLVQARDGKLYGTTSVGGAHGWGTVFQITREGTLTTLYSFCAQQNCEDGTGNARLIQATDGNLYGTTPGGGVYNAGTVFKMSPQGLLTTLHSFNLGDGPSGLVQAKDGNFYGTTFHWGKGYGTVFKITPEGTLTYLYTFCAQGVCSPDGGMPSVLVQAADGNFYGTTYAGGAEGSGTIFKITPEGSLTTSHSFCMRCADGGTTEAGLVQATDGDFYGTTVTGGLYNYGTLFKITLDGALTTLYSFCSQQYCSDGADPQAALVQATDGNFYGTTQSGGNVHDCFAGCGTLFVEAGKVALLSVAKVGNGTLTSSDGHIDCGSICSYVYKPGTLVTLTATPDQGWGLAGWSGCDQSNANVCSATMNSDRTATATFEVLYSLSVGMTGTGTVASADGHIYCGSACSYSYLDGTPVALSALASPGYTFAGWTGCDNVNGSYCSVTMTEAANITATFTAANVTLTSLIFKPNYVRGGQLSAGTLTLNAPAPSGGVTVALSSDHPGVAHPPSFVFVPGGKNSVQFAVNTFPVKSNTTATIMASSGSSHVSATLMVGLTFGSPSLR